MNETIWILSLVLNLHGQPMQMEQLEFSTKKDCENAARIALAFINSLSVAIVGNAFLRAGDLFDMPDFEPEHAGTWKIKRVVQHFKKKGFTTKLSMERPG